MCLRIIVIVVVVVARGFARAHCVFVCVCHLSTQAEYVLFMNDNHAARPDAIRSYLTAAQASGADVLTSFVDIYDGGNANSTKLIEAEDDLYVSLNAQVTNTGSTE